jgi:hypothetical protein
MAQSNNSTAIPFVFTLGKGILFDTLNPNGADPLFMEPVVNGSTLSQIRPSMSLACRLKRSTHVLSASRLRFSDIFNQNESHK